MAATEVHVVVDRTCCFAGALSRKELSECTVQSALLPPEAGLELACTATTAAPARRTPRRPAANASEVSDELS